jgi:hypothetical protein
MFLSFCEILQACRFIPSCCRLRGGAGCLRENSLHRRLLRGERVEQAFRPAAKVYTPPALAAEVQFVNPPVLLNSWDQLSKNRYFGR